MQDVILKLQDLRTCFDTRAGLVTAVDGVTLEVRRGECLGVVGESGSGKSVTFSSAMGLIRKPGYIANGEIWFEGRNLVGLDEESYRKLRGKKMAMTMQDALTALNPAYTIGNQIMEAIELHEDTTSGSKTERRERAKAQTINMLRLVGIPAPETRLDDYPHQFSGGMRQRVMIAIALVSQPELLIADEPTTALDVTIQAQVLELIAKLREKLGMSVVLITHDLAVVSEYCERVVVMYAGQVVEAGPVRAIIDTPRHPYTRGLLGSIPRLSRLDQPITPIAGVVPNLADLPEGCRFSSRCPHASAECERNIELVNVSEGHQARCIKLEALAS